MNHQTTSHPTGCGCVSATTSTMSAPIAADMLQARAIARHLADITALGPDRWSIAYDDQAAAVALRIATPRGLFALLIPPPGRPFPVLHHGRRTGALECRRVPATRDSLTATLFAAYLRDRAAW